MFPWIVNGNSWPWFWNQTCHQRIRSRLCYHSFKGKRCCDWQSEWKKNLIDKTLLVARLENRFDQKVQRWSEAHWLKCPHGYMGTIWFQCIDISGVPTIGTSPKPGIWSIKNINSKLLIHSLIFRNSIFRWRMAQSECIWMCVKFVSFRSVIDERG